MRKLLKLALLLLLVVAVVGCAGTATVVSTHPPTPTTTEVPHALVPTTVASSHLPARASVAIHHRLLLPAPSRAKAKEVVRAPANPVRHTSRPAWRYYSLTRHTAPARPIPLSAYCGRALTYLAAHAKPGSSHVCDPIGAADGIAARTAFWSNGVVNHITITIYLPSCAVAYENEASNSWFDFGHLPRGMARIPIGYHDDHGRVWDPFGYC